jgi:hypothetical protein
LKFPAFIYTEFTTSIPVSPLVSKLKNPELIIIESPAWKTFPSPEFILKFPEFIIIEFPAEIAGFFPDKAS